MISIMSYTGDHACPHPYYKRLFQRQSDTNTSNIIKWAQICKTKNQHR